MNIFLSAVPTASAVNAGASAGSITGATTSLPVLTVQKGLKARGFDPGPLDGEWGVLTEAAYRRWGGTWFTTSADKRTVTLPSTLASGIRSLAATYDATRAASTESQSIGPHLDPQVTAEMETDNTLWWALGAGAVALVGAGIYFSRRKRRRRRR